MEVCFRIIIDDPSIRVFSVGMLQAILFLFPATYIIVFLTSLYQRKTNAFLTYIILSFFGFLYSSQVVYYDFFRTFYSSYSAGNADQILEFSHEIFTIILQNFFSLVLLWIPVILLIFVRKRFVSFEKLSPKLLLLFFISAVVTHVVALSAVYISGKERNSAYDLYYHQSLPILSVERLGLFTTMRIDFFRYLTGWSPNIKEVSKVPVRANGNSGYEKQPFPEKETTPNEPNVLDIDFERLIKEEQNKEIVEMHQYFSQVEPTKKNDFTGKFKGYNFIFITAEAFSPLGVRKDLTPTLYKLVHEGYYFSDFYVPIWDVSTSDGEYVATNGLLPKPGVWSFSESGKNDVPFVMGHQLKKLGYQTFAYHNHTYDYYDRHISHPNMGYEYKALGNGLDVNPTWPESDLEMMELSINDYIDKEPFHAYYMTVSGHLLYTFDGNMMAYNHRNKVKHLPYSDQAKAYLATQIELDLALQYLLEQLEQHHVADRTLIVMSADHYPYGLDDRTIDKLAGHKVEKNFELYKNHLIIYAKGMEKVEIDEPVSSLDILPTISNLLGVEYDSRLLMGRDVFSNAPPLVIFRNHSFITDKGYYNAVTGQFHLNPGEKIDEGYIERIRTIVDQKFYFSAKILEHNYYGKLK